MPFGGRPPRRSGPGHGPRSQPTFPQRVTTLGAGRQSDAYGQLVWQASPYAFWRLSEDPGALAARDTASNNDGLYKNSPTLGVLGPVGNAVSFSGTTRLDTTPLGNFGALLTQSTIELWVKTTSTLTGCVMGTVNTGPSVIFCIYMNAAVTEATNSPGRIQIQFRGSNGSNQILADAGGSLNDGNWHHVVWRFDSATAVSCLIDGVVQTVSTTLVSTPAPAPFDFPLSIGARNVRNGSWDRNLTASLDEIALYPYRLTDAQIAANYQAALAGNPIVPAAQATAVMPVPSIPAARPPAIAIASAGRGLAVLGGMTLGVGILGNSDSGIAAALGSVAAGATASMAAPGVTVAVPAAAATASAVAPTEVLGAVAVPATASAVAPVERVVLSAASATASMPVPGTTTDQTIVVPPAAATASAIAARVAVGADVPTSYAFFNADALPLGSPVPIGPWWVLPNGTFDERVVVPAASATASMPVPTTPASNATPPPAIATASSVPPSLAVTEGTAATATASVVAPVARVASVPASATAQATAGGIVVGAVAGLATASMPVPTTSSAGSVTALPMVATASGVGPVLLATEAVPPGTASATIPPPADALASVPAQATGASSAQTIVVQAPAASATASMPVPSTSSSSNFLAPPAVATASMVAPAIIEQSVAAAATASRVPPTGAVLPSASTATAGAVAPTFSAVDPVTTTAALAVMPVPTTSSSTSVTTTPAVATASAVGPAVAVGPPAGNATAGGAPITYRVTGAVATAVASITVPYQGPVVTFNTATASGVGPTFAARALPTAASASATMPVPLTAGVISDPIPVIEGDGGSGTNIEADSGTSFTIEGDSGVGSSTLVEA